METTTITITQALSKVKLLEARLEKKLENSNFVAVQHGSKLRRPYASYKVEDFCNNAKAEMQSIEDLFEQLFTLRSKIAQSNATTKITIGGREMTVQDAIILKRLGDFRKKRLWALKCSLTSARESLDEANTENNNAIERMVSQSSDKNSQKEASDYINLTRATSLVDPCEIQKKIDELEQFVAEFDDNIDFALSESNSTTRITI